MKKIIACIDGSSISGSVCDAATWASNSLNVPLLLLHVLEKASRPVNEDLSGAIGLGSREHLLEELTALDEQRSRLALEHGKHMLEDGQARATQSGTTDCETLQRHGDLLETLQELNSQTRLLVMGRRGEDHDANSLSLGSHLENVVRAAENPILVTVGDFKAPGNFMIAYDGRETADNAIERIAASPLLKGLQGHLVMVGSPSPERSRLLDQAAQRLTQQGYNVTATLMEGEVQQVLEQYRSENNIELMVMGAYGHSRVRQFFVGSNTARMISHSPVPLLLLR